MAIYTAIMKLDPTDNRVGKYMRFKGENSLADAEAHVAANSVKYPDAFVHEDSDSEPDVDVAFWRFNPETKAIIDRVKRPNSKKSTQSLRELRNVFLIRSDWTQHNDSPLTDEAKAEWATYRQKLRDLPETTVDSNDPTWPTEP